MLPLIGPLVIATTMPAFADGLVYPLGAAATDKELYIVDRNLAGVWKADGDKLTVLFQASKKFRTPLNAARCITLDSKGNVIVGDTSTREVYRLGQDGKPQPLTNGGIGMPMGVVDNGKGTLFVTDLELKWVFKVPFDGGKAEKFAELPAPRGITIDADGYLWIISHGKNQLLKIAPDGKITPVVKGRPFQFPHDVVFDKAGTAYVSDGYSKAIWKVDSSGKPEKWISGDPLVGPVGLEWRNDKLLIVDPRAKTVFEAGSDGKVMPVKLSSP